MPQQIWCEALLYSLLCPIYQHSISCYNQAQPAECCRDSSHTVLIAGAEWSGSSRYTAQIKRQPFWWLHSAVNHWREISRCGTFPHPEKVWGSRLAAFTMCCECSPHCQYVLINKLSKGTRVGKKGDYEDGWWGDTTWLGFFFGCWSHVSATNLQQLSSCFSWMEICLETQSLCFTEILLIVFTGLPRA